MKTRILQILGVAAIATIGMTSCEVDACKDVECGDNGTCVDGDCQCDTGYEGTDCDTEERAKFIGTYNVTEACTSGNYTYSITTAASGSGITTIIISNFGDYGVNVTATVKNDNSSQLVIANQTVGGGTFSGTGQISGNILTITYNVTAGTSTDDCTMTCTKQ
ncbi:MAG: hypothetical protein H6601_06125 [Flavobacteriales bacterium]|nr:hypothetical protein [Flavobacteriales bacterium]